MTFKEKSEAIAAENPEALFADGFEEALIGIGRRFDLSVAVYDRARCIRILMERDGMDREEAEEFFEFNTQGAWMGEGTPVFMTQFGDESF